MTQATTVNSAPVDWSQQVWIRGLLSVAWADGRLDARESEIIHALREQLAASDAPQDEAVPPLSEQELTTAWVPGSDPAENFLRTAVMVALADGSYSEQEDQLLHRYCQVLQLEPEILQILRTNLQQLSAEAEAATQDSAAAASSLHPDHPMHSNIAHPHGAADFLKPVRTWLDGLDIQDPKLAHTLCKMIPNQCPFERDVHLFGRTIAHIPALCKLNPLYEQMVSLRFRALSYLADDCGEDITPYVT